MEREGLKMKSGRGLDIKDDEFYPSLVEIKKALPSSVFRSSLLLSFYYVVRNFVFVCSLFFAYVYVSRLPLVLNSFLLQLSLYSSYAFLMGTLLWGTFVLSHDCGHGSFSRYGWVNTIVGNMLSVPLLVPFEQWRISHNHHHKNTGNIDRDEVFYPMRNHARTPGARTRFFTLTMGLAWWVYLALGFGPRNVPHFVTSHPLYEKRKNYTLGSLIVWGMSFSCVVYLCCTFGFLVVLKLYLVPLFIFASWLVLTTFLHHSEETVVWFGDKTWSYVKGNLNSVDRSYGIFDDVIHNIGTHQVHHLFPIIPHYNLLPATKVFREKFPHLVKINSENVLLAFFRNAYLYFQNGYLTDDSQHFSYLFFPSQLPQNPKKIN